MKIKIHRPTLKLRMNRQSDFPLPGICVVMLLIYLSPFTGSLTSYAAFLLCLIRVIRFDAKVFAVDFALLIPLSSLICTPGGMSLLSWLALLAAVRYAISGGIRLDAAMVLLLLLANYLLTRMQMSISQYVLYFGQMLLICIILPKQNSASAELCARNYCFSLLLSSIYSLVFRNSSQLISIRGNEVPAFWGSSTMRFQGVFEDPNYYALLIILGLALLVKLKECNKISKAIFLTSGITLSLCGLLTFSKTFALVFVLLGCIYLLWQFREKRFLFASMIIIAVVTALALMLHLNFAPLKVILFRFTDASNISELTTGRTDVFMQYWEALTANVSTFLFGFGMSASRLVKDPHNLYLEIAYHTGTMGLVLVLAFYMCILYRVKRMCLTGRTQNIFAKYTTLFLLVVIYTSLGGMFSTVTGGAFFLAFLSVLITKDLEG